MSSLRDAQKQMTTRLLIESALRLFQEKGYAATTVDEIATGAGSTRTTFYLHFASKAQLMQTVLAELYELVAGGDDVSLAEVVAAGEREVIWSYIERRFDQWPQVMPQVHVALQAAAVDPEIETGIDAWLEGAITEVRHGLDAARRFAPETRHVRGVLAIGQMESLSRRWATRGWDSSVGRDVALATMTDSWCALLLE